MQRKYQLCNYEKNLKKRYTIQYNVKLFLFIFRSISFERKKFEYEKKKSYRSGFTIFLIYSEQQKFEHTKILASFSVLCLCLCLYKTKAS